MEPDPTHFDKRMADANTTFSSLCKDLARLFEVEELATSALEDDEDMLIADVEPEAILALKKESRQLLKVIRMTSFYMFLLTIVYLG